MKEKILRVGVAFLIIMALVLGNFIQVGAGLISYAAELVNLQSATNNSNVEFSAYFKNENGDKVEIKKQPITEKALKLYMNFKVKNQGYLNGEINLENSNFDIVKSNSEYVNKIENNKVTLNQLNAGTDVELEFDINLKTSEQLDINLLNMDSDIKFSGIYKDSSERDISINTNRKVSLAFVNSNNSNENAKNDLEVITNGIFKVKGEEKRVIQVSLKQGLVENTYPIKEITTKVTVPAVNKIAPEVQRYITTNSMTSYEDKNENGIVTINMKNDQKENKIQWKNSGSEEIILTYIYDKDVNTQDIKIASSEVVSLYDGTQIEAQNKEISVNPEETKNSIVTANITSNQTEMFKGNLNAGLDRQVKTTVAANVSMINAVDYIEIAEQNSSFFANETELGANVEYNQTTINKAQLLNILGQDGTLTISNQNDEVIATINKETKEDESGNIVIDYTENKPTALKFKTSAPVVVGKLNITNLKTIKKSDSEVVSQANTFTSPLYLKTNMTGELQKVSSSNITLKESTTEAKLKINRSSLSTIAENKGVEIKATLKSNQEEYDLYKNPVIKIALPEDVTDAKVNTIDMLYGEEFQFKAGMATENNRKVITIELLGEQQSYKGLGIEGTTLIIKADLKLNNKATSKKASIDMTYSNENAKQYKDGQEVGQESSAIEIVSPKGLITTNNSSTLGLETIGEDDIKTNELAKGSDAKDVSFESEIINNNENGIKDLKVLGSFGTNGEAAVNKQDKTNNLGLSVKAALNIEATDNNKVKVYYSQNEKATDDIGDKSNGWEETITNPEKVQKYLIVVSDMAIGDSIKTNYTATVPANLEYNKQSYQGYNASYTDTVLGTQGTVQATTIGLETGVGPVAEVQLSASVGNKTLTSGDEVKQGETIKYRATVKNTGSEDLTNVQVVGSVPNGTVLIEKIAKNVQVNGNEETAVVKNTENSFSSYEEKEDKAKTMVIESLAAGESKTVEYEVKVKENSEIGSEISNTVNIKYGEVKKDSNQFTIKVKQGVLRLETNSLMTDGIKIGEGDLANYITTVKNISDEAKKNIKVSWKVPEGLEVTNQKMFNEKNIDETIKTSNNGEITIDSIEPGETIALQAIIKFNKINNKNIYISAVAKVDGDEYSSNDNEVAIGEKAKFDISLSTNDENGYVKSGDKINYQITITNTTGIKYENAVLTDEISDRLTIQKITVNNEEIALPENSSNKIELKNLNFSENETKQINIETVVNYQQGRTEDIEITNQATLFANSKSQQSNIVKHTIEAETLLPDGTVAYRANGMAWLDQNANGIRDDSESGMSGITVKLLNVETNTIQKNYKNEEIVASTDDSGRYSLSLIPAGNYIVLFDYDSTQYLTTTYKAEGAQETVNSDATAKEINIDGTTKTYGVTDNINLTNGNVSNINIGLIKAQKYDMSLGKYVGKITVQNKAGTKTYNYNNESIAKVELDAKQIANSNVIIEYNIVVTNEGEVPGYIKNIADYIPTDLKFNSELNKDWYQTEGTIYNNSLANEKIAAGEQRTVKLILTKTMTENNTGLINNTAEIAESYNEYGIADTNSTPGNKATGENDMGSADVIISVRTGGPVVYISLTISIIAIAGVSIYLIRKQVFRGNI